MRFAVADFLNADELPLRVNFPWIVVFVIIFSAILETFSKAQEKTFLETLHSYLRTFSMGISFSLTAVAMASPRPTPNEHTLDIPAVEIKALDAETQQESSGRFSNMETRSEPDYQSHTSDNWSSFGSLVFKHMPGPKSTVSNVSNAEDTLSLSSSGKGANPEKITRMAGYTAMVQLPSPK